MQELKKHAEEKARPLINQIFKSAEQGAEEYLADQGLDYSEDSTDRTKEQYLEYFNDKIRNGL